MICLYKKTFLKDLAGLPDAQRKKIEKIVFEEIPGLKDLAEKFDFKKMQGYENYYRIRVGSFRVGCEIQKGNRVIFYRIKNRKDIYRVFP